MLLRRAKSCEVVVPTSVGSRALKSECGRKQEHGKQNVLYLCQEHLNITWTLLSNTNKGKCFITDDVSHYVTQVSKFLLIFRVVFYNFWLCSRKFSQLETNFFGLFRHLMNAQ